MDTPKPTETSFFDEHKEEVKDLAKAVGENKPEAMVTAACALFAKVLIASWPPTASLAAPAAAMAGAVFGKRFGEWFADSPTARLQAAEAANKKRRLEGAKLRAFAAVAEAMVTKAVQPVLARLASGERMTEDSLNDLADGMCEALDGLTRVEAGISRLHSSVHELLCQQSGGETSHLPTQWPSAWDFTPYMHEKQNGFVGRAWMFEHIRSWCANNDSAQALLIIADFGVGKSAIMAELASGTHGLPVVASHFCHRDTQATLHPATFVRSVAAQLAMRLPGFRDAVEADATALKWLDQIDNDPSSALERAVLAPLHAMTASATPQLLLVDGLDEALDLSPPAPRSESIVQLLTRSKRFPRWMKVLATTRRRHEVIRLLTQTFFPKLLTAEVAQNSEDIRAYVTQRCATTALARILDGAPKTREDIVAFLSEPANNGGKFLYVVRVLQALEAGALESDRLHELPPGMDGFYYDAFERRFPHLRDYETARALLGILCVAREPMRRADLASVLQLPERTIRSVLKQLEDFLIPKVNQCAFDHASIAQWLAQETESGEPRAGAYSVDVVSAESEMAAWATRTIYDGTAHESEYLSRHLVTHLTAADRRLLLPRLLHDLRWLRSRLGAAGIQTLLADWQHVEPVPPLSELERALRQSAHVLRRIDPDWSGVDMLGSQLIARLARRTDTQLQSILQDADAAVRQDGQGRPLSASLSTSLALVATLEGRSGGINDLVVLPDGRIASGSDETIQLWNVQAQQCDATLEVPSQIVEALFVLPDGRLASGLSNFAIEVWNVEMQRLESTLESHAAHVVALAVLRDGRLASGSLDKTIKLWNVQTQGCDATLEVGSTPVATLVALPDGNVASGSWDAHIRVINPETQCCDDTLEGHTGSVRTLIVLPNGHLASGSRDQTIRLWDLKNRCCYAVLEGHAKSIMALALLRDGRLASASKDKTIKLWDLKSLSCDSTLEGHSNTVTSLGVLPDGILVSGSLDGTIRLWDTQRPRNEVTLERHTTRVIALARLPGGRLVSAAEDKTIKLWDTQTQLCVQHLEAHSGAIALAVLSDGRLAAALANKSIELWHLETLGCETLTDTCYAEALAVLPDGRLASGGGKTIKVWNILARRCEATLEGHHTPVTALAVLPDGRIASGSEDGTIRLWDRKTLSCSAVLEGHSNTIKSLAAFPDGRLVSMSFDKTIRVWNPATLGCDAVHQRHTSYINDLAAMSDGRVAFGSSDNTVRLWYAGHEQAKVVFVADAEVTALMLLPDASVLCVGDEAGRVHFVELP
jgi:WD40 repeat protein